MILEDKDIEYVHTQGIPFAVYQEGAGEKRGTGDWRIYKPVMHHGLCAACHICWAACPDAAIHLNEAEKPVINYALCKGCLICWQSCPNEGAVEKVRNME